jgi:hypothetical protein
LIREEHSVESSKDTESPKDLNLIIPVNPSPKNINNNPYNSLSPRKSQNFGQSITENKHVGEHKFNSSNEEVPIYKGVLKNIKSPGLSRCKHSNSSYLNDSSNLSSDHHSKNSSNLKRHENLELKLNKFNPKDSGGGNPNEKDNKPQTHREY